MKAERIGAFSDILRERGLTQIQAAAIVGVVHPNLSTLLRGRAEGFSVERLIRLLAALGYDLVVQVRSAERLRVVPAGRPPEAPAEAAA